MVLEDQGSPSGVFVDGERVDGSRPLTGDEKLRIGDHVVELSLGDPTAAVEGEDATEVVAPRAVRRMRRSVRRATIAAAVVIALILGGPAILSGERGGESIVSEVAPSTALVLARAGEEESVGSGWVLDARRGLVVTNFHVISGGQRFEVGVRR